MQILQPYAKWKPWQERIRHFTWSWYSVVMGTGMVSTLLYHFPYGSDDAALQYAALGFDILDAALFLFVCICSVASYIQYPEIWPAMLSHPTQSLYIGCFPAAATTMINAGLVIYEVWGFGGIQFLYALWGLWWLVIALALLVAFGLIHTMVVRHDHSIDNTTPTWLLPVVPLSTTSSSGGLLAAALKPHSAHLSLITSTFSLAVLLASLPLAVMIIAMFLQRLIIHGPPNASLILSAFIILGPVSQGGWSLLLNGQNLSTLLPLRIQGEFPQSSLTGQMLFASCFDAAFMLWAIDICWIIINCLLVAHVIGKNGSFPLTMAYWGLIFPNGAFSLLCLQLGTVLESQFFQISGAVWSCVTMTLWLIVFLCSIPPFIDGSIFHAPYICDEDATSTSLKEGDEEAVDNTRVTIMPAISDCTSVSLSIDTDIASIGAAKVSSTELQDNMPIHG